MPALQLSQDTACIPTNPSTHPIYITISGTKMLAYVFMDSCYTISSSSRFALNLSLPIDIILFVFSKLVALLQ